MAADTTTSTKQLTIWWIKDGKAGHEKQSLGLINALCRLRNCQVFEFAAVSTLAAISWQAIKQFPPGKNTPRADLIIGAGHKSHFTILAASAANKAKSIVLMKPSLPTCLFDLCFIPSHDKITEQNNVVLTEGAITNQTPSNQQKKHTGIILVGGPSKHYLWDKNHCIQQIKCILEKEQNIDWIISDSRRTPAETSKALQQLNYEKLSYRPFNECPQDWLDTTLPVMEYAWVSEDSVSMIYEALSAGCKTAVLNVEALKTNKLTTSIASLIERKMVVGFDAWNHGTALIRPQTTLIEADRAASIIIKRFFQ